MKSFPTLALAGLFVWLASTLPTLAFKEPAHAELPDFDKRQDIARHPAPLAGERADAAARLRTRLPKVHIALDKITGAPKHIAATEGFLSGPRGEGRAVSPETARTVPVEDPHRAVKAFLGEHALLYGHGAEALAGARLKRDFVTEHNGLRSVVWEQRLAGVAVYEAVLVGHLTRDGELVNISSTFIPGLAPAPVAPLITVEDAMVVAAESIGEILFTEEIFPLDANPEAAEQRQIFLAGPLPGEAEARLVWLPLDRATLRLCWQIELTRREGGERYRVLVDAQNGDPLARRCLTVYLSDATYRVFTGDSPTPFSPGHPTPSTNQPPSVPRSLVTLAALNTNASPIGWISDGQNETRGNNVDAHTDRNADDSPDLPRPHGSPFRVFDFPMDLDQSPATYSAAAAVQLFYWCNFMHDKLYELGFTEAAGNFQKDNFGRGGLGNDAVSADAQDGSGSNNANFTPTADGTAPRIQMFIFTGPNPDRDGDFDAEIVIHEYTHGLSDRLVGGGVGIGALQTAGMGEGWSDWYALTLLSEASDNLDATYAMGAYATSQFFGLAENYYYGIRRYPYSTDLTKSPLTFKDIDPTQASAHTGIPKNPVIGGGGASEVHNQGEVWCVMLWEARAALIRKHGFSAGNQLILQLVTDGMKLSPPNPNFVQARDAILQAELVNNGGANFNELWAAFARRGLGFSATSPDAGTTSGVREAYDLPDSLLISPASAFFASGPAGGPFTPACQTYTLTNHSAEPLTWTARVTQAWLTVTPSGGTLAVASATTVTVCLNSAANALPLGSFADVIRFSNTDSGVEQTRAAQLRVVGFTSMPFTENFESGALRPFWTVSGTGTPRALVTANNAPHGGVFHLTLDSAVDFSPSRNEITLGLDLGGFTNVVLRFWAKSFSDEPDGPPASPFLIGADFDGVAISADGLAWYEVQALRTVPASYAEFVVNLDAAVAAHGLAYNSTFRIRFNQFDNYAISLDGLALDDITITGVPARRFVVSAPAQAREGDGVLANQGRVSLGAPPAADLTVQLMSSDRSKVTVPPSVLIPAGATGVTFNVTIVDNTLLDGTQVATISATTAGYFGASATIAVHDNERASLKVKVSPKGREGDGMLKKDGVVEASKKPARDVIVSLTSSDTEEVLVPATVVIPAGKRDAKFEVTIVDDHKIDGKRRATITAHVENWEDGSDTVEIRDNDTPRLFVELPARASESDGPLTNGGTVRLSGSVETNVVVTLTSSDATELTVSHTVTIPAGDEAATFDLNFVDDASIDGLQTVSVEASARGFAAGSASMGIFDDETPPMLYGPNPPHLATGVPLDADLSWHPGIGEIVVNGGFEAGNFNGWVKQNLEFGDFIINDGKINPEGPDGPLPPLAGNFCAFSQQIGGGTHVLYQELAIPADARDATLSWAHRIRNHASRFEHPNQEFRLEIRDVSDGVLATPFMTQPGDPLLNDWTQHSHDLTGYRGRTIRVAFVQRDNLNYFNVHVDNVSVLLGEPGVTTYDVYFGTNPTPGPAQFLGTASNAAWELPTLALDKTYYWRVVSKRGTARTTGPVWQFTTRGVGEVVRFEWDALASPQPVNQPFPVTLSARDDIGNVATNFAGPVSVTGLRGTGTASAVLITEIDPGTNDRVEFANVSGRTLDLSGWQITLYDGRSWPLPRITFILPTNTVSRAGETFVLSRLGTAPGAYPNFFAGTNVFWLNIANSNSIAVLLRDGAGSVVDFACAADANPALITQPMSIPPDEWMGNPLALETNTTFTYQRTGHVDHNDRSDWSTGPGSIGTLNPGLALPFASRAPLTVTPTVLSNFVGGVWRGNLTVGQIVPDMRLLADDAAGHLGLGNQFAVTAANDLSLTLVDSPDLVIAGDNLTYTLTVANSGPAAATGVKVTDPLPAGVTLVSVVSTVGTCVNTGGVITCELGALAGGASASFTIVVGTTVTGTLTNTATATRDGTDTFLPNNTVTAVTTVNFPAIIINDVTVTEGNTGTTNAVFTLRLSAPSTRPVSVNFATADLTALAGVDYQATTGTLVFPPGVTSLTLSVPVFADLLDENLEVFLVNLSALTNVAILDGQGQGRINDDDAAPLLSINDVTVTEGAAGGTTNAVFTVWLAAPSGLTASVNYGVSNNTAVVVSDFEPLSGTVTFPPGVTEQTITVGVRGDNIFEPTETFHVILSAPANVTLSDSLGVGTILDDDATALDHFELSEIPSPSPANIPFPVTITAKTGLNETATNYTGIVALRAFQRGQDQSVGSGTNLWEVPLGALYHDARVQSIYLAGEIGGAAKFNALALDVAAVPGQALTNFTIRLKPTRLDRFAPPAWESAGWMTVFRQDVTFAGAGFVTFFFDTAFNYDGTNNLMVDVSFNNASYTGNGLCRTFVTSQPRSVYFQSDSAFGDPLAWSGETTPPALATNRVPNLRLSRGHTVTMTPTNSGNFVDGAWTGQLTILEPGVFIFLAVSDGDGHIGLSNGFDVNAVTPSFSEVRLTTIQVRGGEVRLSFSSNPGQRYRVEWSDDLGGNHWKPVADNLTGNGALLEVVDDDVARGSQRFYRVRLLP